VPIPVWRLTRSRPARRLYDALDRLGLTVTRLREYHASLDGTLPGRDPPAGVSLSVRTGAGPERHAGEHLAPGDVVVTARIDDEAVGRVFVALDRTVYVHALRGRVRTDGAYVFGLWVDPRHRGRGIATALVARACRAADARGVARAVALVAPDNAPSRWVFEGCGFTPGHTHAYDRLFGWERRSSSPP
jgi:GNAT superfamily N-acetyltransferase